MNIDHEFPQQPELCYLNHAAVAPWPQRTLEAVTRFAQENVLMGATHYPRWLETERRLRKRLAKLINANGPNDIALAKNTSEALSIVAYGIQWSTGDEVIISNEEFPSNRIVWESLNTKGVKTRIVDIKQTNPEQAILDAITPKTKLVSI
ncbi:MAG: aminotransferase class V-fold PLP-dependent enzyme, partial [Hahellaceae bacterium]|nr:aminotransferase class V-fold PLP-dependent enzyme [Hahellaceae bacterium]